MSPQGVHGVVLAPAQEYTEFFRAQFPSLVRNLVMAGATAEEAKDMVQEAMLELLSIWSTCGHPAGWVRKVAWHKYLKAAARDRRRTAGELRSGRLVVPAAPVRDDPDEVARVRDLLLGLPARQRAVMALYVDGFSMQEIAELLKMEVSTVRSNLRHARTTLRRRLEEDPPRNRW